MPTARRLLIVGCILLVSGIALLLFVAFNERASCTIDNLLKGYFGSGDFSSSIKRTESNGISRFEFGGVDRFDKICVVSMYGAGQPYDSKEALDLSINIHSRKACWRNEAGKLTLLGSQKDKSVRWAQLNISKNINFYPKFRGTLCADPSAAIECDETQTCKFVDNDKVRS